MEKKIFYFLYIIGILSLFIPFYENFAIGCGIDTSATTYESRYLYQDYYENFKSFKPEIINFVGALWLSLVLISILFSPLFYIFKKLLLLIILNVVSVLYFVMCIVNAHEMLVYGFYILFFQQLFLLGFLIKKFLSSNKIK